jgi:hypothetical protein
MSLIVAPLVVPKSHAYTSYTAPVGVAVPARHMFTSVPPQRHGVRFNDLAHPDLKIPSRVAKQADACDTGGPTSNVWAQVFPSGSVAVPPSGAVGNVAFPVSVSQMPGPPALTTSKQLAAMQLEHNVAGVDVFLSCCPKQPAVEAAGLAGSQRSGGGVVVHIPAVEPVEIVQVVPAAQVPQLIVPPQPSGAVPHLFVPQAAVEGVQTQTLLVQANPAWQAGPHVTVPVQPSEIVPQLSPAGQVVFGVQTQLLPEHVVFGGVVHWPHVMVPPHPSGMVPQVSPAGHALSGVQPHTFAVPPPPQVVPVGHALGAQVIGEQPGMPGSNVPQLSPLGHDSGHLTVHDFWSALHVVPEAQVPQLIVPPQPSGKLPQMSPVGHAVIGLQTQVVPLQLFGAVQVPQLTVPPHPSDTVPQVCPAGHAVAAVAGTQTHLLLVQLSVEGGVTVHWPQLSVPPQPSGIDPQVAPAFPHVVGVQPH